MPQTYRATIEDDHIVWEDTEHPDTKRMPLAVQVTVREAAPEGSATGTPLAALKELRKLGGLRHVIPDPIAWQREQRKERPLPGRD